METLIWHSKLDADFHQRYWTAIANKYGKSDCVIKLALAIAAFGAVAVWGFWEQYSVLGKSFSAATAVLAITAPFIQFGRKKAAAANLAARWTELRTAYEQLWKRYLASGDSEALQKEYQQLNQLNGALQKNAPGLQIAHDAKLLRRAQEQVLQAHGARSPAAWAYVASPASRPPGDQLPFIRPGR